MTQSEQASPDSITFIWFVCCFSAKLPVNIDVAGFWIVRDGLL